MAEDATNGNVVSSEELRSRYKEATRLTAGVVYGKGDGRLGPKIRDAVCQQN